MKVKINDTEVELRFTFDAFIEYEKKWGESLGVSNDLAKTISFEYFTVLCSKKGWQSDNWLSYEDFTEWMNDDPYKYVEISEFIGKYMNMENVLTKKEADAEKKS